MTNILATIILVITTNTCELVPNTDGIMYSDCDQNKVIIGGCIYEGKSTLGMPIQCRSIPPLTANKNRKSITTTVRERKEIWFEYEGESYKVCFSEKVLSEAKKTYKKKEEWILIK